MKYKFALNYFMLAVMLFLTEILIGFYLHDAFIRPFGGDYIVVILMYCTVKSFFNIKMFNAIIGVLTFSYLIEVSQYYKLVYLLGLGNCKAAVIILGSYFSWWDILCYTLGMATVAVLERLRVIVK